MILKINLEQDVYDDLRSVKTTWFLW